MEERETLPLPKATGLLRELQLANLDMMKKFDKIARENNIKYTLGAGSAIGAIVHKGFIPWDDDIDILMDRENYDKLKELSTKILPPELEFKDYFSDQTCNVLIGKIIDNSTTMITVDQYGRETISGVAIDVSVFDSVPNGKIAKKLQWLKSIKALILANKISPQNHGKLVKLYGNFVLKFTKNKLKTITKLENKIKKYTKDKCTHLAEMLYLGGNKIYFENKVLEDFIDVQFEDVTFMITKHYDYYLKKRYNRDYTILPDKDKRIAWHNCKFLDTKKGFRDYLKEKDNEV